MTDNFFLVIKDMFKSLSLSLSLSLSQFFNLSVLSLSLRWSVFSSVVTERHILSSKHTAGLVFSEQIR